MNELHVQGLTRLYAGGAGMRGIDLRVAAGELFALLGPSGCGKTTLLRTIAGLTRPEGGRVMIGGRDVTALPPERRGAVMLFQQPLLFPHLTVAANIGFSLHLRRLPRQTIAQRTVGLLSMVQLQGLANRFPSELSGGQQQRVALARALAAEPQVLLLDEPFSALDAPLRAEMREQLRSLQRRLGITMLFVTHDQEEASLLGDRLAVMAEGRLLQVGTAADLYYRPASAAVAAFFGTPSLLPGTVRGGHLHCALGTWPAAGEVVGAALAVIHPEQVLIEPGAAAEAWTQVLDVRFAGGQYLLRLQAGSARLQIRLSGPSGAALRPGQRLGIRLQGPVWCVPADANAGQGLAGDSREDASCSA